MAKPEEVLADPERLAAVREVRELGVAARAAFDRLARLTALVLRAEAYVNLVGAAQFVAGVPRGAGGPDADQVYRMERTLCSTVVATSSPLLVEDARTDARFATHPACTAYGLVGYAGMPVRDTGGRVIGTLCAITSEPRRWSESDRFALDTIARAVTSEIVLYQSMDHHQRLLDAFDAAPVAVAVTRGRDHAVEYLNPVFREVFGDAPADKPGREAFPDLAAKGFFSILDRVLRTGHTHRASEEAQPADGGDVERYFDLSCSQIASDAGESLGVLVVAVDVTAQVRARQEVEARATRHEAAARATAAVSRSLDPQIELDALARSVVPTLADVCTVYQIDEPVPPGRMPRLPLITTRITTAGPPGVALPGAPSGNLPWPGGDVLTQAVLTGRPVREGVDPANPPVWAEPVGLGSFWRAVGVHAVVAVPVIAGGSVLAVVLFSMFRGRTGFTDDDLTVLQQIGVRASVAIGHGMAYQRSREHALALQRSMLTDPPRVRGLELEAGYQPAGEDAEVGGDWYDAFLLPCGDLAVVIGDVVGHDMAAAASMGQLRSMLRALAVDSDGPPHDVLTRLDRLATGLEVTNFATLLYGRIRRGREGHSLRWAHAGHPPPVLIDRTGHAQLLTGVSGLVLGARPESPRCSAEAVLPPGSTLLLYTDGLTERRGGRQDDDVVQRVGALAGLPLNQLCDELLRGAPPHDDVALLVVRVQE